MEDCRHAPRTLTLRTGRITAGAPRVPIDCAILNESATGAGLLVPRGAEISNAFTLVIDPGGTTRRCRLVWRRDCRLGICFTDRVEVTAGDGVEAARGSGHVEQLG